MCCLRHRGGACNTCRDAGNARPGAAASVAAFSRLHESEFPAPARVLLACLCMRADFVRPANMVIKNKVLCVYVLGPCFLCTLDYFCNRVTCPLGQTSAILSLRGHVVGFCMNARAYTGLRAHVTFFHGKISEECYNPDGARPSEASTSGRPRHTSR